MPRRQMTMAKADDDDIEQVRRFMMLFEIVCEPGHFDIDNLEQMDEDDEDRKHLQQFIIKDGDKWANGSPGDFDYSKFFNHWVNIIGPRWRRVVFGCDCLIATFCDPTEDHLSALPGIDLMHVAPEQ